MGTGEFIALYCLNSLFWKWIISWGGAQWLEGWKSIFVLEWFAWGWNAEQLRRGGVGLYHAVLCGWPVQA